MRENDLMFEMDNVCKMLALYVCVAYAAAMSMCECACACVYCMYI